MLVLRWGETGVPAENLSVQSREPRNTSHIWRRIWETNPGHIGGRRVLSPLPIPAPSLYLFFSWLFDCYCVRGPLILVLKINLLRKRLPQSPSMGSRGSKLWTPGEAWNNDDYNRDNDDEEDGDELYSPVVSTFTDLSLQLIRIIFW